MADKRKQADSPVGRDSAGKKARKETPRFSGKIHFFPNHSKSIQNKTFQICPGSPPNCVVSVYKVCLPPPNSSVHTIEHQKQFN